MQRPTCPKCERQHGPGILCETFATWEDNTAWESNSATMPFTYDDLVRGAEVMERSDRRKT